MNLIAFCSALDKTFLAIKYNENIYSEIIKSDENYHSLYLISKIKDIFEKNKLEFNALEGIIVNCGPGSFTGIRVAMSVAKVMAGELNLPLIPLDTASILLSAYNCDKLIMDARRDMFFVGTNDKIELVLKNNIKDYISENDKLLADKNSKLLFSNAICYEDYDKNIAINMLELGENKLLNSKNNEEFNYMNIKANYIQTPPVF